MEFNEYDTINSQINTLFNSDLKIGKIDYWHYTTLSAILSMFKGYIDALDGEIKYVKDCTIYASNARYMNDPEEFLNGRYWFNYLSGSNDPISFDYSLISFSNKGDNLDHWKYYGKKVGISLCFDMDKTQTCVFKKTSPYYDVYDKNNRPLKVYYNDLPKIKYYAKLVNRINGGQLKAEYLSPLFVPFCKDEAFHDEAEYRMVFFDTIYSDYVYNTSDPQKIKPATNVKFKLIDKSSTDDLLKGLGVVEPLENDNILSCIVVGPGNEQELVFNTLIHVFDRVNYHYIDVPQRTSDINPISENLLKAGESGWIECEMDRKSRFAYRCLNGILIMISAISFRA